VEKKGKREDVPNSSCDEGKGETSHPKARKGWRSVPLLKPFLKEGLRAGVSPTTRGDNIDEGGKTWGTGQISKKTTTRRLREKAESSYEKELSESSTPQGKQNLCVYEGRVLTIFIEFDPGQEERRSKGLAKTGEKCGS